jgi:putative polyketide hydroxylase
MADSTSVLVVGGSLVGLSAAVFLAWRGVPVVVVERHPGSSPHPRAIGFTTRTLELYRAAGLGPQIPQVPPGLRLRRVKVESLAGKWHDEVPWGPEGERAPTVERSPCTGAALAQDRLEPILRDHAVTLGAEVRGETELVRLQEDADGIVATVRTRGGEEGEIRARYAVAADGHKSGVREALGIGRTGRGHLQTVRSVIFRAELEPYRQSGFSQFVVQQAGLDAFLTTYADGRWLLIFSDDQERDEGRVREAIYRAIGRRDLDVEIVTTGRWEVSALIADRFSSGRVLLAGDAAHTLPPNRGGYGANTGVEDAHNLAWKIAAVLSGASAPRLLETYDAERRPVAWLRHEQIFAWEDFKAYATPGARTPVFDSAAMELGHLYRSSAVLGAGDDLPAAKRPEEWAGQPGTRAPHVWVERRGERVSTLDLLQRSWVVLSEDERWCRAASAVAEELAVAVEGVRLGADVRADDPERLRTAFGIGAQGVSLVRPDGYIAWRSPGTADEPAPALRDALGRASSSPRYESK